MAEPTSPDIIRSFLIAPLDSRHSRRFIDLSFSETVAYLRRLCIEGWRLPDSYYSANGSLTDLAFTALGPFLASRKNRPYFVIFDYFKRHGISDFETIDNDEIVRHFRILLRGFVRKEVTTICGDYNPQIRNLKRRIKQTLKRPDYASRVWPGEAIEHVYWVANEDHLREIMPVIPRERLMDVVRRAFQLTINRKEWCRDVFYLLNTEEDVRNALPTNELVSAMVAVNAEYVDAAGIPSTRPPTPADEHLSNTIANAIETAMDQVESSVMARFLRDGRISVVQAASVRNACRQYLEDLGRCGTTDSIPNYLSSLDPQITRTEYTSRYKYIMDSVISRAIDVFRHQLKSNPTIWTHGSYWKDE